ncbi:hypothetical protein IQ238_13840 [Pleurocapsales cyanobacterium LEGE 06147]|nr:hypothetical protein [Pleurocapsales cyanobacterium LEGE 06147]
MLAHYRKSVCLSLFSTNLPVGEQFDSTAYIYQKDREKFHLLLNLHNISPSSFTVSTRKEANSKKGLLWLEISPYRVIMTMQRNESLSYRHFWEAGIYGVSRYWLNGNPPKTSGSLRLRNYTRYLKLDGCPLPTNLRIEYELWSGKLPLGSYNLHLDINC